MEENPDKQEIKRNSDGTFIKGVSGNPAGRPVGLTLKEYVRRKFMTMTDDEKEAFISGVDEKTMWTMAEGNPAQHTDLTTGGEKIDFSKVDPRQQAIAEEYEKKLKETL